MPRVKQEQDDEEEEFQPETKKAKTSTAARVKKEEEEDEHENEDHVEDNQAESETDSAIKRNADGEAYFELGPKKRCTVRKWNNNVLVDIREVIYLDFHFMILVSTEQNSSLLILFTSHEYIFYIYTKP